MVHKRLMCLIHWYLMQFIVLYILMLHMKIFNGSQPTFNRPNAHFV